MTKQTKPEQTDRCAGSHGSSSARALSPRKYRGVAGAGSGRDPSSSGHRGHPSAGLPGLAPRGTRGAPAGLKGVLTPPLGLLTLPPVRSDLARPPKDAGQTPATAAPRGRPARDAGTWGVDGAGRCVASP